jgi:hypothetical protein
MGTRGPIPKKANLLHGHGAANEREATVTRLETEHVEIVWPEPGPWEPAVVRLYESLQEGAMADLYEQSDAEFAWITCEILNRALTETLRTTGGTNTALFQAALSALGNLGVTEGARRRLGIEIEKAESEDDDKLAIMASYRKIKEQTQ